MDERTAGMMPVVSAVGFTFFYALAALVCGLAVFAVERRAIANDAADENTLSHHDYAALLIGSGFAPLMIGLLQGCFWIVLPHLPLITYAILHFTVGIVAVCFLRKPLKQ